MDWLTLSLGDSIMHGSTHAQRLERWIGSHQLEQMSRGMRDWQGPPIPLANVPGLVWVTRGGDFCGPLDAGYHACLADYAWQRLRGVVRRTVGRAIRQGQINAGFAGLADLINEAEKNGKKQHLIFRKTCPGSGSVSNASHSFNQGALPPAGGVGGTSGTGRVLTNTSTGALKFVSPTGGDFAIMTEVSAQTNVANSFMVYDRLWDMTYNHATALSTAIDANNRPNRYQTAALAPGSVVLTEVTTALSATAHNITVTYVDQNGNTAEAAPAYAAAVNAAVGQTNLPGQTWFMPMASPDNGVRYLTNIAQSTITSVTGVSSFIVGHPLVFVPQPVANVRFILDGINSAFNLIRVFDTACLAIMDPFQSANSSTTHDGIITLVSG